MKQSCREFRRYYGFSSNVSRGKRQIGIGFALNARHEKADYRTFVILGDGECNEGSVWEAALCAAKQKLALLPFPGYVKYNYAKKRGLAVGKTRKGKGTKCMVVVDGKGIPLGSHTDSASPAEVRLAETTLRQIKVPRKGPGRPRTRPKRVIGDKAYDSDPLRKSLRKRGINLLSPHRSNHRNVNRQDDRLWDRYRRRYTVERTFSWFGHFRRIVVRYEHQICMYEAFLQVACVMIVLKRL